MKAFELKKGMVVRAPWRDMGDDANLTGVVVKRNRDGGATVRWNADGDCTKEGDESIFDRSLDVEVVS